MQLEVEELASQIKSALAKAKVEGRLLRLAWRVTTLEQGQKRWFGLVGCYESYLVTWTSMQSFVSKNDVHTYVSICSVYV